MTEPAYEDDAVTLYAGDALATLKALPDASVQTCITSPPYWGLRDYGVAGQLGLEATPDEYVAALVAVFAEVRRVLADDGTCWLNLGDTYCNSDKWGGGGVNTGKHTKSPDGSVPSWAAVRRRWAEVPGIKPKDLIGIPWRVAFALQADGWYLRSDIIWAKPNPMPESVTDRPTKAHEYLFLLSKSERYFYDAEAISEPLADANAQRTTDHYDTSERGPRDGGNRGLDGLAARMRAARKSDMEGENGRNVQLVNSEAQRRDEPGTFNNNPRLRPNLRRNRRSVWTITTQPYPDAHFATFPPDLVKPCVLAGSRPGDAVLDPFAGSGTTLYVAKELGRRAVGIELNPAYCDLARRRLRQGVLPLAPAPSPARP